LASENEEWRVAIASATGQSSQPVAARRASRGRGPGGL